MSRDKILERFWILKDSVVQFLKEINELPEELERLEDNDWLSDLAFLVDITAHLNAINLKLQGSNKLFTHLYNDVLVFKMKLRLLIGQLAQQKLDKFPTLKELKQNTECEIRYDKYTEKVEIL